MKTTKQASSTFMHWTYDTRVIQRNINDGIMTLGFMTQEDVSFLAMPGRVAVYLPFSYSMSGTVVIVDASRVTPLAADSASVMALIVSGGVSRVSV